MELLRHHNLLAYTAIAVLVLIVLGMLASTLGIERVPQLIADENGGDGVSAGAPTTEVPVQVEVTDHCPGCEEVDPNATRVRGTGNMSNYTFIKVKDPFEGYNVDLEMSDSLEFLKDVPVVDDYWRKEKVRASHKGLKPDGTEPVKVACLYAGFVRDFEKMWMTCGDQKRTHPRFCHHPKRRKFFGQQRANILDAMDCDVFMSTWDIRGAGRFNTHTYIMNKTVSPGLVKGVYGNRLARLHMQNYSAYQPLWFHMFLHKRNFPQTHPTVANIDERGRMSWEGVPETNPFVRLNDYSQSYKQWCVLQLVNRYSDHYDLYFRLRTDLRVTHRFERLRFATAAEAKIHPGNGEVEMDGDASNTKDVNALPEATGVTAVEEDAPNPTTQLPTSSSTSSPSSKLADADDGTAAALEAAVEKAKSTATARSGFKFKTANRTILFSLRRVEDKEKKFKRGDKYKKIRKSLDKKHEDENPNDELKEGEEDMAKKAGVRVYVTNHSVHASRLHVNNFDIGDFGFLGPPAMVTELSKLWYYCIAPSELKADAIEHDDISEYNLMLWHVVFSQKWEVDSGGRYLWVSRRGNMEAKKLSGGSTILKVLRGSGQTVRQSGGSKVVVRKVRKKV